MHIDDDSSDINESVDLTGALGVVAARAAATESESPLIEDRFARMFLDAAGEGIWSMYSDATFAAELTRVQPDLPAWIRLMVEYTACRTAFFDGFFLNAANAGVRQMVILASGLDAR